LLAYPHPASAGGDDVIARARATEAAEVQALARAPIELHTHGYVNDGKASHQIESFRLIRYRTDGTVLNQFQRGQLDGKPIDEEELRKAIGAQDKKKEHGEILTYALAPLSSPEMEVTPVGPAPSGGFTLRCKPKDDALVSAILLVVDEKTGHKRSATMEIAGLKAKLADRIENVLVYGEDGGPADFHASFHVKLAWIERSAEFSSKRISSHR
jgi:hypothetical protein